MQKIKSYNIGKNSTFDLSVLETDLEPGRYTIKVENVFKDGTIEESEGFEQIVYGPTITIGDYTYRAKPVGYNDIKNLVDFLNYSTTYNQYTSEDQSESFSDLYDIDTTKFYGTIDNNYYFSVPAMNYLIENQNKLFPGYHIATSTELSNMIENSNIIYPEHDGIDKESLIPFYNTIGLNIDSTYEFSFEPYMYGTSEGQGIEYALIRTSDKKEFNLEYKETSDYLDESRYTPLILCKNH